MSTDFPTLHRSLSRYDVSDTLDRVWPTYHVPPNDMPHVMAMITAYFALHEWGSAVHVNGNTYTGVAIRYNPGLMVFEVIIHNA